MPFDLNAAIQYALCVRAAEAINSGDAPNYQPPAGFQLVQTLFANDLVTDISPATDYVPFGFVARKGSTLVIAIRGTANILEWVDDAQFLRTACPIAGGAGETEDGFSGVYTSLRIDHDDAAPKIAAYIQSILQPGDSVVVCGHSLGGALATLCAYDLALNVKPAGLAMYTYASPNVGNQQFADSFNAAVPDAWRIVNPFDVVPHVPLRLLFGMGYQYVGQTESFNPKGLIKTDFLCFHHLTSYLHLMGAQAGIAATYPLDPECCP